MVIEPIDIRWCRRKQFSLDRFGSYLNQSLECNQITNNGPLQAVLADKIKGIIHTNRKAVPAASGTAALHALAGAWSLQMGRKLKWVTQAFTFPSSFQGPFIDAIVVDIDKTHLGPCFTALEAVRDEIDGIVVTNPFGFQTNILEYEAWCIKHNKLLVFDNAATPIGFTACGRNIHDIGDGSIISLHETKPLGRGEGGCIFVSEELEKYVYQAINFGFNTFSPGLRHGNRFCSNLRMSDIAAAAICDHLDAVIESNWVKNSIKLMEHVVQVLKTVPRVEIMPIVSFPMLPTCLLLTIKDSTAEKTKNICSALNELKIEAKQYYVPLVDRTEAPLAWKLYETSLCLPFNLDIRPDMMVHMIKTLDHLITKF